MKPVSEGLKVQYLKWPSEAGLKGESDFQLDTR